MYSVPIPVNELTLGSLMGVELSAILFQSTSIPKDGR